MKSTKTFFITAILLFIFSANLFAQDDTIRVETNFVSINVSVTDKKGNFIKGLTKENFEVFDGNKKQDIEQFSLEGAPVYFGIVYDLHPTTDENTRNTLEALRQFTKDLQSKDNFFVTVFNERGNLTTDFVPNEEQINQNLNNSSTKTSNSLYDVIFEASEKVRSRKGAKQILIVLTDGEDRSSHHSLKELRLHLQSVNLPIYTIAMSNADRRFWNYSDIYRGPERRTLGASEFSALDQAALKEISKSSGGKSFEKLVQNRLYLNEICKKVLAEVENQYVIGFYPESVSGKKRKLTVKVSDGKKTSYKLSYRKSYQIQTKK